MNPSGGARGALVTGGAGFIGMHTGAEVEARYDPPRPGDVRDSVACLDRARDLLGYAPAVDLRERLRRTVDSFRAKGGAA